MWSKFGVDPAEQEVGLEMSLWTWMFPQMCDSSSKISQTLLQMCAITLDDDDSPSDATIVKFISYFIKLIQTPFSCWCEHCIKIEYSIFSMTCNPRRYTLLRHFMCYNILGHHKAHVSALVLFFFLLPLENSSFSSQCLWTQNNFTFCFSWLSSNLLTEGAVGWSSLHPVNVVFLYYFSLETWLFKCLSEETNFSSSCVRE